MSIPAGLSTGIWNLDIAHSEIGFTVRHAGISKVRGKFTEAEATIKAAESLEASSLQATVRSASFNSGDANRDAHVKGPDFFDVERFPTLEFTGTEITGGGEDYTLAGNLTIHGVTLPVEFQVEFNGVTVDPFGATRAGFSAETTISRKDFGLTWNAALEAGGVLVSDKVKITLDVAFVKES